MSWVMLCHQKAVKGNEVLLCRKANWSSNKDDEHMKKTVTDTSAVDPDQVISDPVLSVHIC